MTGRVKYFDLLRLTYLIPHKTDVVVVLGLRTSRGVRTIMGGAVKYALMILMRRV